MFPARQRIYVTMIRAHVAAPQSGGVRTELQREDSVLQPKTPGTPKPVDAAPPSASGGAAAPTEPELRGAYAVPSTSAQKRRSAPPERGGAGAAKRLAPFEHTAARSGQVALLALARSSGGDSPLAAHRLFEAVQGGALRQVSQGSCPTETTATGGLDPMCCVGCGTLLHDFSSVGLRCAPTQWEWTCEGCLQPARHMEQRTHQIGTPEP